VLGDDEMTDIASADCEKAPCDVVMPGFNTPNVGISSVVLRPRHHNRAT
jgi:hypothetical protein